MSDQTRFDPARIGAVGRVVAGDDCGAFVRVVPVGDHFMLYLAHDRAMTDAFDAWMYDLQDVDAYFARSRWQIEWD